MQLFYFTFIEMEILVFHKILIFEHWYFLPRLANTKFITVFLFNVAVLGLA